MKSPKQLFEAWYRRHFGVVYPWKQWQVEDRRDMQRAYMAGRKSGVRDAGRILKSS